MRTHHEYGQNTVEIRTGYGQNPVDGIHTEYGQDTGRIQTKQTGYIQNTDRICVYVRLNNQ